MSTAVRPIEWLKKVEKRQLWVRPIGWLKLNFEGCVVHQTRSLDVLILYFIYSSEASFYFIHPKKKICTAKKAARIIILVLGGSLKRYCCPTLRQYDTRYVQYRATSKKIKKNRTPSTRTGSDTHAQRDTHAQQRACDNCGQRNRGCSCCLMDRVAHDQTSVWVDWPKLDPWDRASQRVSRQTTVWYQVLKIFILIFRRLLFFYSY